MGIEKTIYDTFLADAALLALLANGKDSINEGLALGDGPYPEIIFYNISTVPVLTADDKEKMYKITMQVSIITADGEYDAIKTVVDTDMHQTGFMLDYENEISDENTRTKIMRYVILQEVG